MRKSKPQKRYLLPDPKFHDVLLTKFVNYLMKDGKKSIAYNIFYDAIDQIETKTNKPGIEAWKQAIINLMPSIEVKSRRVGGATFQVPVEVRPDRKINLAFKWLIDHACLRSEKNMTARLVSEIIAASRNEGAAIKKKDDTHRMADANKAFSHFRF